MIIEFDDLIRTVQELLRFVLEQGVNALAEEGTAEAGSRLLMRACEAAASDGIPLPPALCSALMGHLSAWLPSQVPLCLRQAHTRV